MKKRKGPFWTIIAIILLSALLAIIAAFSVLLLLLNEQRSPASTLPALDALVHQGVAVGDKPPLISEAVAKLNELLAEAVGQLDYLTLDEDDIWVIVDLQSFNSAVTVLNPNWRLIGQNFIAFVRNCKLPIWVVWENDLVRQLQERFELDEPQPAYLMAGIFAHELGYTWAKDAQQTRLIEWAVLSEFEKRGKLPGYEGYVRQLEQMLQEPHGHGCSERK
ncbi:MAG: hypothetical protein G01um101430_391 [Parcubacteria group bacterium Gr01-1014_30]|nr:MAG: hypothetical protein G01um101430_391 [Parcubacteria group bacterium Gr01-1014_30]